MLNVGAAGIGKEIARAVAANGATVGVCDIDASALFHQQYAMAQTPVFVSHPAMEEALTAEP